MCYIQIISQPNCSDMFNMQHISYGQSKNDVFNRKLRLWLKNASEIFLVKYKKLFVTYFSISCFGWI